MEATLSNLVLSNSENSQAFLFPRMIKCHLSLHIIGECVLNIGAFRVQLGAFRVGPSLIS